MMQNTPYLFPCLDAPVVKLPQGWILDGGFPIFTGVPIEIDLQTGPRLCDHHRSCPFYQLAIDPEGFVPNVPGYNYCLHMDPPYVGVQRKSRAKKIQISCNYVGSTDNYQRRLNQHLFKQGGSPLIAAAIDANIRVTPSGVWLCASEKAARQLEGMLKAMHNNILVCPTCMSLRKAAVPLHCASIDEFPEMLAIAQSRMW